MSWDEELWLAVSLIQSAPHRAAQHRASDLIVRYAFPPMCDCFCSRFLLQQAGRVTHSFAHTHTHTKRSCVAHKQVCILHPATATDALLFVTHTTLFAFKISGLSGLYVSVCADMNFTLLNAACVLSTPQLAVGWGDPLFYELHFK